MDMQVSHVDDDDDDDDDGGDDDLLQCYVDHEYE
jgi:hypothetical protein